MSTQLRHTPAAAKDPDAGFDRPSRVKPKPAVPVDTVPVEDEEQGGDIPDAETIKYVVRTQGNIITRAAGGHAHGGNGFALGGQHPTMCPLRHLRDHRNWYDTGVDRMRW